MKKAISAGIDLEVIPGPSALIAALAISGMDTTAFVFEGFLPSRSSQRRERLEKLKEETRTIILYEAPHRLLACLKDIELILGEERQLAIARELTKVYEEVKRGSVTELYEYYSLNPPRGEISIIIEGKEVVVEAKSLTEIIREVEELLEQGMDKKEAFKTKAREYGIKKSMLYNYFVKSK